MKKFLKSIFTILCLSLVALAASVFMIPKSDNKTYAINDNMHTVNFYDGNNLLYSLNIEDGKTLNELSESNLIKNSNFANYTNSSVVSSRVDGVYSNRNICDYWYWNLSSQNGEAVFTFFNFGDYGVEFDNSYFTTQNYSYIKTNIDSLEWGETYTLSCLYNNTLISSSVVLPNEMPTSYRTFNVENGYVTLRIEVSPSSNEIFFNFLPSFRNEQSQVFNISWCKLEKSDVMTDYFDIDYINKLYRASYDLDNSYNIYWSIAQSTGQYDFDTPITQDTNIYGYEELEFNNNAQQLQSEITYQPSYYLLEKAIDNIEYIHYKGSLFFNIFVDTSKLEDNLYFLDYNTNTKFDFINFSNKTSINYLDGFAFTTFGFNEYTLNLSITSDNNSIKLESSDNSFGSIVSYGYDFYLLKDTGIVTFTFSLTEFIIDNNNFVYDDYEDFVFYDGTYLNDMNSNTNYFLNIAGFDNFDDEPGELVDYKFDLSKVSQYLESYIAINFNGIQFNDIDKYLVLYFRENDNYISYNQYESNIGNAIFYLYFNDIDDDGSSIDYGFIPFSAYTIYSGFKFSQFDIVVRKPVARVDNSLVIFNFGYNNFLIAVTQVKYELRRGFNYYDVVYNGSLENSKMIVIDNEYVRNSLFDEYIFVSFLIDGTNTTTFDTKDGKIGAYLGFDFNFVYYTQPLIAGNASYDLMQYRPEYMDGTPSLYPFRLPVTAWIYNAFLWLIFDCPLISDILGFLHLQSFMGALLNILDLYVNSGIGQFLLACLSFIIFWLILKSLMPSIVGGLTSSISTTYKDYSDNKMEETALKMNIARQQMRQKGRYKAFKFNKGRLNYHKKNGLSNVHHRMLVKKYFTGSFKSSRPKYK